jgi:protein-tyrosine kinase
MDQIKKAIERAKASRGLADAPRPAPPAHRNGSFPAWKIGQMQAVALNPAHLERAKIVAHDGKNPMSIGFDMLRTKLFLDMKERNWKSVLITSPTASCGKTVTAANLAMSIARQPERRVILVDCDLRKPQVSNVLGFRPQRGISDVIKGTATLDEAMYCAEAGNAKIWVLPAGPPNPNPTETLISPRMKELVAALASTGDNVTIIFDSPPVLVSDDVIAFLPQVDGVLLAVAANQSRAHEVESSMRNLPEEKFLGTVLTKSSETSGTYNYY